MSDKPKHVAGPWTIKWPDFELADDLYHDDEPLGETAVAQISAQNWTSFAQVFVVVSGAQDDCGMANAQLIATAPDLLAACEQVVAFDPGAMFPMRPSHVTPQEWRRWCQAVAAVESAVKKAKGGAS